MQITFIDNEKKAAGALGALLDLKNVEKCVLRLLLRVKVLWNCTLEHDAVCIVACQWPTQAETNPTVQAG